MIGKQSIKQEIKAEAKEDEEYRRELFAIFLSDPVIKEWIRNL